MLVARKVRRPIPEVVSSRLLYEADRTCCVCNESGKPVQIHHIDNDPSNNAPDNLAVLCLICHNETEVYGGFGRRLDAAVVTQYRNAWVRRVAERRARADELAAGRTVEHIAFEGREVKGPSHEWELRSVTSVLSEGLESYIDALPGIRQTAIARARPLWDSGVTAEMMSGSYEVIETYISIMTQLARWYPDGHFGRRPRAIFEKRVKALFRWHRRLLESGPPPHGTIVGVQVGGSVMRDAATMIVDMVSALQSLETPVTQWQRWLRDWERSDV